MSRRTDAARRALGWAVRAALVGAWAFVGWGTLLLLATVVGSVQAGPAVALGRLVPGPDGGLWGWLNAACALAAALGWAGVVIIALGARREPSAPAAIPPEGHGK